MSKAEKSARDQKKATKEKNKGKFKVPDAKITTLGDLFTQTDGEDDEEVSDEQTTEEKAKLETKDEYTEDDAEFMKEEITATQVELRRRGERQQKFRLRPSKMYIKYIGNQNAIRRWSLDGKETNSHRVRIAILTEKIRMGVLHCREFRHDYLARHALELQVKKRRFFLDKLSWESIEDYIEIRTALKIRHRYRMEALIGRARDYKYGEYQCSKAPDEKVILRIKKTRRLYEKRLATALRDGNASAARHAEKKIVGKQRYTNWREDVQHMVAVKEVKTQLGQLETLSYPQIRDPTTLAW